MAPVLRHLVMRARAGLGRRGVSAAEFALLAPILVLLTFGAYDLANIVQLSIRLERAARAGAQVAAAVPSDSAAIAAAVVAAWPDLKASEVQIRCGCAGAAMAACSDACPAQSSRTVAISAARRTTPLLLRTFDQGKGDAVIRLR